MQDQTAHMANGQYARFAVIPPDIAPLQGGAVEQQDGQIERQGAFEAVPVAFSLIPLEVAVNFRDDDIRQRQIYVKGVSSCQNKLPGKLPPKG